ncbi:hypothetical protein [Peribacillus kribbensis]|uniref:hypothetical protein n=1 Tax=Peribacillus kribbensis TaxID=356658 RepID=UPI000402213D|nr:hypothetical protein [Peribacillus kribbensis]
MRMSRSDRNSFEKGGAIKAYTVKNIWENTDFIITLDIELENGLVLKDAKMEITKEEVMVMSNQSGDLNDAIKLALGF